MNCPRRLPPHARAKGEREREKARAKAKASEKRRERDAPQSGPPLPKRGVVWPGSLCSYTGAEGIDCSNCSSCFAARASFLYLPISFSRCRTCVEVLVSETVVCLCRDGCIGECVCKSVYLDTFINVCDRHTSHTDRNTDLGGRRLGVGLGRVRHVHDVLL